MTYDILPLTIGSGCVLGPFLAPAGLAGMSFVVDADGMEVQGDAALEWSDDGGLVWKPAIRTPVRAPWRDKQGSMHTELFLSYGFGDPRPRDAVLVRGLLDCPAPFASAGGVFTVRA